MSARASTTSPATAAVTKVHALEEDGVVRQLYGFLFRMQRALRTTSVHAAGDANRAMIGLPIPDTVVYANDFPQAWFTHDAKSGELLKLPGRNLDARNIFEGFSTPPPGCGGVSAQFTFAERDSGTGAAQVRTLYLTPGDLAEFLHGREAFAGIAKEGVLQRFVPPRGEHNESIEIVWSPHVTQISRRANVHAMHSRHADLRTKACTYDAPPHLYIETLANASTQEAIIRAVSAVAERLLAGEHKTVSRFVGLFKQGRDGRVLFLHATSIRVEGDALIGSAQVREPLELMATYAQPPSSCTNNEIDQAHDVDDAFIRQERLGRSPSPGRARGLARAAARDASPVTADNPEGTDEATSTRRRRQSALWGSSRDDAAAAAASAEELQALRRFVDDTLYALYANRLTLRSKAPVAVSFPSTLLTFLGITEAEHLMLAILDLQAAPHIAPGIFMSRPQSQKPLATVRSECAAFLACLARGGEAAH